MAYINREERLKLVGFNDYKLIMVCIPVLAFFFPMLVFQIYPSENPGLYFSSFLISALHILMYWVVERYIIIRIRKRYEGYQHYRKRIIIQSVTLLISTYLLCWVSETPEMCFGTVPQAFETSFFNKYMAGLIITLIVITIYEGIYAFELFKRGLIKNEELQRKNTQAQLESLKNQVNPHFLFNSLNTLISVIPENTETAVKFAERLADVYRYVLEIKDKELITIKEEMEYIEAFQYLLSIRFGDHIQFKFENLDSFADKYIVPLSIQMLIENAIKHNVISQSRPLTISITAEADELIVCNNLQEKTKNVKSTGVGIKNIEKRYQLLAGKKIIIEKTDDIFCVKLPIMTVKEAK